MSKIGLWYEVELRDRNGKVVKRFKRKSDSWLVGFVKLLKSLFYQRYNTSVVYGNVTAEDGSTANPPCDYTPTGYTFSVLYPCCRGDAGDVTHGIAVGNSDTPNTLTTYALGSKISHGNGSGQLLYGAVTIEDVTNPSGNILQFRIIRVFTNSSGADVTVKEFGLLCRIYTPNGHKNILLARDVLTTPITIPDGYSLTLRYIVKITVV
jgi:hypothetical protein